MIAIKVKDLSRKFKLYSSPKKRLLEYLSLGKMKEHTDFWALKDISFEIPAGTTVGIIGQNGSGKSTLLSILAGVLPLSEGSCEVNGKVSAILELGSGFHPEFSGRDNVYMYGSIIGLSKEEIDERYDEILHFSELGDFIDQPLRTYSSGMIVRLAFSVAVNVNSDILIVDEALAVGDAIFQHRCFRKIKEMQAEGKTILYVGHDTEAVRNLCSYAMLLDGGKIIERGDVNMVVNKYMAIISDRERMYNEGNLKADHIRKQVVEEKSVTQNNQHDKTLDDLFSQSNKEVRYGNKNAEIIKAELLDENGRSKQVFKSGELAIINMEVLLNSDIDGHLVLGILLRNKYGDVYGIHTRYYGLDFGKRKKGDIVKARFSQHLKLGAGFYSLSNGVSVASSDHSFEVLDRKYDWLFFKIDFDKKFLGCADLESKIEEYV
jgi:teichoic acid transport system ATP-binding protein